MNNAVAVYNLLNDTIFAINEGKYSSLKNIHLSELQNSYPVFFSAMKKLNVVIPQNFNETNAVILKNRKVIFGNDEYRLTINPTLECNFNCWYC